MIRFLFEVLPEDALPRKMQFLRFHRNVAGGNTDSARQNDRIVSVVDKNMNAVRIDAFRNSTAVMKDEIIQEGFLR